MTVKELIKELKRYPEDLETCFMDINGYQCSIDTVDIGLEQYSDSKTKVVVLSFIK